MHLDPLGALRQRLRHKRLALRALVQCCQIKTASADESLASSSEKTTAPRLRLQPARRGGDRGIER